MKLTADQYYYVYFCMFEEPAMFKTPSTTCEQAVQMYLCEWFPRNAACLNQPLTIARNLRVEHTLYMKFITPEASTSNNKNYVQCLKSV